VELQTKQLRESLEQISQERDRSDELLLNILPSEIAHELKEKGKAEARNYEMVSLIFTDFKEFTEISEKMNAIQLVDEINHCFIGFDSICEKHKVEKIKTIGDAYMAVAGLPIQTPETAKVAVNTALEMQEFIQQRKVERERNGEVAFEMRIGIHSGPVVAGIVGSKKFQYDLWGDTVNTASRIEQLGEVGKVNISQATYNLLKKDPDFVFESRGKLEVKGKGEMAMWFVSKA
jgi:class 3 adenylate cyclase